jgi:hypothetical protein
MGKESIASKAEGRQEVVQPIPPETELEIIKEILPDGKTVYRHPTGSEVGIWHQTPLEIVDGNLARFQYLADLMGDDVYDKVGYIVEGLVQDVKKQVREMFKMIESTIGEIECDGVMRDNWPYRTDRIVGISLKPAKSNGEEV